jgi:hypothetical protein
MMNIDLYYLSNYALPIANVLLVAAAALAIVRVQRVLKGKAIYSRLWAGNAIEKEIATLTEQSRLVSARLSAMQETIERLGRIERLLVGPVSRELPMEHAARLAKDGASVDELTRHCGLNIGEARLIRRLHGRAEASKQVA